jgi:hypothetical protein
VEAAVDQPRPPAWRCRSGHECRIGGDAGDAGLRQEGVGSAGEPRPVARFAGDRRRGACGERREERGYAIRVEGEARGELDEERAEPVAQVRDLGQEAVEIGEPRRAQAGTVRDGAREFDREALVGGHRCGPPRVGAGQVVPVERRTDLDRPEALRVPFQMAPRRWEGRVARRRD